MSITKAVDLRSDTVTRPGAAMRRVMCGAEVGDDVFGDDPTVRRLEAVLAEMLGKEASLFTPSSTQSNLIALLTHCGRGDEYLVGQQAHCYLFEGGGGAALGGLQPQPMNQEEDGTLDLRMAESLVKPDDFHFARTRLLCLENTTWGKVLPFPYLAMSRRFADSHRLALHLDGARIFNAAVASGKSAGEIAAPFDSISVCLSKGLGAPVGSLLAGPRDFVREAKRWRKMTGGGMRQSGILAAAGLYALEHHIARLGDDHANASRLADGLAGLEGIQVDSARTNMVFLTVDNNRSAGLVEHLGQRGILTTARAGRPMRLCTHLDISEEDIDHVIRQFAAYHGS